MGKILKLDINGLRWKHSKMGTKSMQAEEGETMGAWGAVITERWEVCCMENSEKKKVEAKQKK